LTQFKDLNLNASILAALTSKGYTEPTPIQLAAIPGVMAGRDLLGIAQTGTGKTAAFALPILHRLAANRKAAPKRGCRALVLSPTRELATQIAESFKAYGSELGFSVATIFGGVGHGPQRQALARGVDVIVAAPGRLLDHLQERDADLSKTEIFVLDEADQMLDMGFIDPIRRVVRHLPRERQNLFFSATMPSDIEKLANDLLTDPLKVSVAPPATTVERINQQVIFVEAGRKRGLLTELFANPDFSRVLVFTRTKRGADKVARILEGGGVPSAAIHGNKSQAQREKSLAAFKAGGVRVLVATDIAARGIDVEALGHVVNFDVPVAAEDYIHRVGRTARAELTGEAYTLVAHQEEDELRAIERAIGKKLPRVTLPDFNYGAKPEGRLEIPIGERLAAHRAKRGEDRARQRANEERRAANTQPQQQQRGDARSSDASRRRRGRGRPR
jgi:ATP-dependent RNA helicase RhlE